MSAKVTIWVWKQTKIPDERMALKEGPLLLTLLTIADMARDNGKVWASHAYMATKARQSPRTIRANIETLESRGWLRTEPTPGRPDVIWLNLTATVLFEEGPENDEPGALEKGPRRPRQETPQSTSAPAAGGIGAGCRGDRQVVPTKQTEEPKPMNQASEARGARLPEGWEPDANIATLIGLSSDEAADQFERFKDYWVAIPGAKGRKLDWPATWRTWCRNAMERRNGRGSPATRIDFAAERDEQRKRAAVAGAAEAVDRRGRQRWRL